MKVGGVRMLARFNPSKRPSQFIFPIGASPNLVLLPGEADIIATTWGDFVRCSKRWNPDLVLEDRAVLNVSIPGIRLAGEYVYLPGWPMPYSYHHAEADASRDRRLRGQRPAIKLSTETMGQIHHLSIGALVLTSDGYVLLRKRGKYELAPGYWDSGCAAPNVNGGEIKPFERLARRLERELGVEIPPESIDDRINVTGIAEDRDYHDVMILTTVRTGRHSRHYAGQQGTLVKTRNLVDWIIMQRNFLCDRVLDNVVALTLAAMPYGQAEAAAAAMNDAFKRKPHLGKIYLENYLVGT
jgi:hypothetical protein